MSECTRAGCELKELRCSARIPDEVSADISHREHVMEARARDGSGEAEPGRSDPRRVA